MPKSPNPKVRLVRLHNSYLGHAAMMRKQCQAIMDSTTTSLAAKRLADEIQRKAYLLSVALKTRIDK